MGWRRRIARRRIRTSSRVPKLTFPEGDSREGGRMRGQRMIDNERGIALVVVLLVVVAVAAIIAGSPLLSSSTTLTARHEAPLGVLETAADDETGAGGE